MKREIPTWVWGCGIGCGALVLLIVAGLVGVGVFVRDSTSGFAKATETQEELESRFGKADEFVPWADGAIPRERMEAFLAVREATLPLRRRIAATFEALPTTREEADRLNRLSSWEKFKASLSITREALGLGAAIGGFFETRNRSLLEQSMGMGEYTYIYVLAYYSWLRHPPDEGLTQTAGGLKIETRRFEFQVRDRMLKMLESQLADAQPESWEKALEAELEAMRSDSDRIPWPEGPPSQIAASLEPYRERLEATYNPICNEFELGLNRSTGFASYTLE